MSVFHYRPATPEQTQKYMKEGNAFVDFAPGGHLFKDCRRIAAEAIAEYLANQRGRSIFDIFDGKDMISVGRE